MEELVWLWLPCSKYLFLHRNTIQTCLDYFSWMFLMKLQFSLVIFSWGDFSWASSSSVRNRDMGKHCFAWVSQCTKRIWSNLVQCHWNVSPEIPYFVCVSVALWLLVQLQGSWRSRRTTGDKVCSLYLAFWILSWFT